ncbi:unnamed protein product [Rhizophagus irregularis]|nr:unnamed protein product [Rhizophagus irregularis]CAB4444201.1 unnamed protein product [Rhizophagus irregularis]
MNTSETNPKTKARDLWIKNANNKYQLNVIISPLEEPTNSTNSHSDDNTPSPSSNLISECMDCQLSELDLNEDDE